MKKLIFLSAGHYPASPGARTLDRYEGRYLTEHDLLVPFVAYLSGELWQLGLRNIIVPTGKLRDKINFVQDMASKLQTQPYAYEFHLDASISPGPAGSSVWVDSRSTHVEAEALARKVTRTRFRGTFDHSKSGQGRLAWCVDLPPSGVISAVIELGFITNKLDVTNILTPQDQYMMAISAAGALAANQEV